MWAGGEEVEAMLGTCLCERMLWKGDRGALYGVGRAGCGMPEASYEQRGRVTTCDHDDLGRERELLVD